MSDHIYIGIDPGKSGGLASIGGGVVEVIPMPATERDIWEWFYRWDSLCCVAVIEWIHPAIQGIGKSPMSKLYGNYMQLRGYLIASKMRFEDEKTAKWCRELGIPPRKKTEGPTQWKNRLKAKAQELFPQINITLKTADALLIAEFCRRKWAGVL